MLYDRHMYARELYDRQVIDVLYEVISQDYAPRPAVQAMVARGVDMSYDV